MAPRSTRAWPQLASRRRFALLLLPAAVALSLALWLALDNRPTETDSRRLDQPARAARPPARPNDYVGSQACARCHADVAATFVQHPMGHSSAPIDPDSLAGGIEDYRRHTSFQPQGNRSYRVESGSQAVMHYERMQDAAGQVIYDDGLPVRFSLGSGQRGRGYLIDRGGILFASPISWYSQPGQWDLSPGYAPASHRRFSRRVGDRCLSCHVGRVAPREGYKDNYLDPPFLEVSIGCERCHGPGGRHVELQSSSSPPANDTSIVNPASLQPARRDSVCYQCHLQGEARIPRYGREHFDFRPGDLLEDIWTVLVQPEPSGKDTALSAVSQVEQMHHSTCYRASGGKLSCISCHDPHVPPDSQNSAEFYRARCLDCHAQQGCSFDEHQRRAVGDSCISCHMPKKLSHDIDHASQTDHLILRKPRPAGEVLPIDQPDPAKLVFFADADRRMEQWEVDRARGLALLHSGQIAAFDQGGRARLADELLTPVLEIVPDDTAVLETLGQAAYLRHEHRRARDYLESALRIEPNNEYVLSWLVQVTNTMGDGTAARRYVQRFLKINPWMANMHVQSAYLAAQAGDYSDAIQSAQRALELDPTLKELRRWLADIYQSRGRADLARQQHSILQRMQTSSR